VPSTHLFNFFIDKSFAENLHYLRLGTSIKTVETTGASIANIIGEMVALGIETGMKLEHIFRAIGYTKATTFTKVGIYFDAGTS
jgi:hypothetical protein